MLSYINIVALLNGKRRFFTLRAMVVVAFAAVLMLQSFDGVILQVLLEFCIKNMKLVLLFNFLEIKIPVNFNKLEISTLIECAYYIILLIIKKHISRCHIFNFGRMQKTTVRL